MRYSLTNMCLFWKFK